MKISAIIPVKNGAASLERCLQSLRKQTLGNDLEIIILDSMSADTSREIALHYGAMIIDVPDGTFDHGLTRNLGASQASGELLYYTVQDAWIADHALLEKMAKHFDDPHIKGVAGHQAVPHEKDTNPLYWYRPYSKPQVSIRQIQDETTFKKLPVKAQRSLIAWDDVVSMYRRNALIEHPFVQTEFCEDWIWSYQALIKGWKLVYDPSLVVYHYHHPSYRYAFQLAYTEQYHFYKFFRFIPGIPALITPVLSMIYHLMRNDKLSFRQKLYWIRLNGAARLGKYFSTLDFRIRLSLDGENGIEKGYRTYCKTIPQGMLKKNSR